MTTLFITRPIMTTLVMAGVLLAGILGYLKLPVSDLPNVDYPTLQVQALLPGANPDTMASTVATPLERQFSAIAGLDSMNSVSSQGYTQITLQFVLDRSIDAAAQDVQAAISKALRQLPPNMPAPPSFQRINPADQPVLFLALSSPTLPLYRVHEYAETMIGQRISMIPGVAQVGIYGAQKYAVRVRLNPDEMAARGIGIDEVQHAIEQSNVNLPTGTLYGNKQAFSVQTTGQLFGAAAYRAIIVAYRNGNPVRLDELGDVIDGVENDKSAGWFNGVRALSIGVMRQPGTNTVEVNDRVRALLPAFRRELPASVKLDVLFDRSVLIRDSIADVSHTLWLTIGLVILVIFLFLRNATATAIPSLALPLSLIGTFAVCHLLGFSLNNLTLMALTLSVGFVVDDAIVMLENIVRHMEMGKGRMEAALEGAREVGFTIVSMTVSLVAVFIPVLFLGGIVGRLLREFAVTISVAILVSGFVSLSLTPMLCSRFLRPATESRPGLLSRWLEGGFLWMARGYARTLAVVMRRQFATLALSSVLLAATVYLFVAIPKGFLPSLEDSRVWGISEGAQDVSYDAMERNQLAIDHTILSDPRVTSYISYVGSGFGGPVNAGRFSIQLKPRKQRGGEFLDSVMADLRAKLARIPGANSYLQAPPPVRANAIMTKSPYQLTFRGPDAKELYRWAPRVEARLRELPGFVDVSSDMQINSPQVLVNIDRDRALALGVSPDQIENVLYTAYGNRQVTTMYAPSNQYAVITQLLPQYQDNPDALAKLHIRSVHGQQIPLNAVARLERTTGPLTINHIGQLPAVTLSFDLGPSVPLGKATGEIERVLRELRVPATITFSFLGTLQVFQDSLRDLTGLLVVAVLVIYLVLGVLYESFWHPLTILSGLPSAVFGALLTLRLFGYELNLFGFVGLIMLFGIVKKNAIMMIDFALEAQRTERKTPFEAIREGCLLRFRPIMMTTMAALVGAVPIALGLGASGHARRP
ncbi:MAG: efflux RND transporter permease subunit, partial [Bryobacteraceae bacterium]